MPHDEREDIIITNEEVEDYLFEELVALGYAPSEEELEDIADILYGFMVQKGMLTDL